MPKHVQHAKVEVWYKNCKWLDQECIHNLLDHVLIVMVMEQYSLKKIDAKNVKEIKLLIMKKQLKFH